MFKRLRERIAEEATKFPVGQNFGTNNLRPSDSPARSSDNVEDLITLSDSSAVIDPLPSSPQFSIAGDEDASFSDPNSPQKKSVNSSAGSELYSTPNNKNILDANSVQSPNMNVPPYIPQTDIESEVEEPPTLNLDGISKEQLLTSIEILKARLCKYKNKYAEVVKAYKVMNEDKKKLEHALTENQDKSLRRIAELREQCQLEQKAKAHLEENLRLILEEKDSRISVLETQINLLKEGPSSNPPSETESVDQNSFPCTPENASLQEKVQKLQSLLKDCKATIFTKTEQITELSREKEMLSQKIVAQSKACEDFEEKEGQIRMEYDKILAGMKNRLTDLEQQQEDSIMSMAETKKNMHEELELKERQLVKMKEEIRQLQSTVEQEKNINVELKKQNEEKVRELLSRINLTEQVMEEGKQSLVKELSRAKAEAIALIQQEHSKKVAAVDEEWSEKLKGLESDLTENFKKKEEEILDQLSSRENDIQSLNSELNNLKIQLQNFEEKEVNNDNSVKEFKSEGVQTKVNIDENLERNSESLVQRLKHQKDMTDKYLKECCYLRTMVSELEMDITVLKRDISLSNISNEYSISSEQEKFKNCKERLDLLMEEKESSVNHLEKILKDRWVYKMLCCENGDMLQFYTRENHTLTSQNNCLKLKVFNLENELASAGVELKLLVNDIDKLLKLQDDKTQEKLSESVIRHVEECSKEVQSSLKDIGGFCSSQLNDISLMEEKLHNLLLRKNLCDNCMKYQCQTQTSNEGEILPENCAIVSSSESNELANTSLKCKVDYETEKQETEKPEHSVKNVKISEMRDIFSKMNHKLEHTLNKNQQLIDEYKKINPQRSIEKYHPKSKKQKKNRANLESIREIDDVDSTASLKETGSTSGILCQEVAVLTNQAHTFENLLNQVEEENSTMQQEIITLKQWAENCELKYVSEIASLQKYLNDAREECSNLGLVLQSLESEIEERNNNIDSSSDEAGSRLHVSYLKSLIHDMQRREVGLSNLLQKTKSRYENEIAKMNSELVVQMEAINSHTDYLDSEIQSLKDHLQESHKRYAVEREHLLQQISCRNHILAQLRNVILNITEMFHSKMTEFQDKVFQICETYNQRISLINQSVCKNMQVLLQQCKLFHELQKQDTCFGQQYKSTQKFNNLLTELDKRFKDGLIIFIKKMLSSDGDAMSIIEDALNKYSLADISSDNVIKMCCDVASMELEITKLREKLLKYDEISKINHLPVGDPGAVHVFVEDLKLQGLKQEQENEKLRLNSANIWKSLQVQKSRIKELKEEMKNAKETYVENSKQMNEKIVNLIDQWEDISYGVSRNNENLSIFESLKSDLSNKCFALVEKEKEVSKFQNECECLRKNYSELSLRMDALKEQLLTESAGYAKEREMFEAEISKLKQEILYLEEVKNDIQNDHLSKIAAMEEESKIKLDEQSSEFLSKLKGKEEELRQLVDSAEKREKDLKEALHNLNAELSNKQNALEKLEKELLNLKSTDCEKMEEFLRKIKQLEQEREQLMLQAQERVAATDLKYREEMACLQEKVKDLSEQNKEIAKLKNENSKLSYQLDESLLVAAGNQSAAENELSKLKEYIQKLKDKLTEKDTECIKKEEEFSSTLSKKNAAVENLKQDKESLNEKLRNLQNELIHAKDLGSKVAVLQNENQILKSELDSLAKLKLEKEELNSRISSLEHSKEKLNENIELLKAENCSLRTTENLLKEKLNLIENEKVSLADKLIEVGNSKCQDCAALKCDLEKLREEHKEKLLLKDSEAENKLKLVIKEFYSQMNIKDYDCDKTVSELLEQSKCIEEKLQKEHKLEVAALRQDIFEKDYAIEEMHEHYETLMKEKDAIIKELEKNSKMLHGNSNSDPQGTESSDWDDTWVVPEESCETMSPLSSKGSCDKHKKEIEDLQEELEKCNTELKDLRILLRLTPPQSLHSNNNYGSSIPISEPTEFEYLKNILFNYMMGKETMTLVKVITAVLRFSEEQTRLIIEREKAKHQTK